MAGEANVNAVVTVRLASVDDADAIGRIQVETWRAAYTGLMPDEVIAGFDAEARQRLWRAWFEQPWPGSAAFVAVHDGDVVGFANSGPCREDVRAGELYAIYVRPPSWGTGAGRALIQHVEEWIRSAGFREAILWVLEGNERAERFYRAAGWEHDGGSKVEAFQGATVTELRYRKRL